MEDFVVGGGGYGSEWCDEVTVVVSTKKVSAINSAFALPLFFVTVAFSRFNLLSNAAWLMFSAVSWLIFENKSSNSLTDTDFAWNFSKNSNALDFDIVILVQHYVSLDCSKT